MPCFPRTGKAVTECEGKRATGERINPRLAIVSKSLSCWQWAILTWPAKLRLAKVCPSLPAYRRAMLEARSLARICRVIRYASVISSSKTLDPLRGQLIPPLGQTLGVHLRSHWPRTRPLGIGSGRDSCTKPSVRTASGSDRVVPSLLRPGRYRFQF